MRSPEGNSIAVRKWTGAIPVVIGFRTGVKGMLNEVRNHK